MFVHDISMFGQRVSQRWNTLAGCLADAPLQSTGPAVLGHCKRPESPAHLKSSEMFWAHHATNGLKTTRDILSCVIQQGRGETHCIVGNVVNLSLFSKDVSFQGCCFSGALSFGVKVRGGSCVARCNKGSFCHISCSIKTLVWWPCIYVLLA